MNIDTQCLKKWAWAAADVTFHVVFSLAVGVICGLHWLYEQFLKLRDRGRG